MLGACPHIRVRAFAGVTCHRHVTKAPAHPAANWPASCGPSFGLIRRPLAAFEGPLFARVVRAWRAKRDVGSCLERGHGWPSSKLSFSGAPVLRRGPDDQARRVGARDCAHLPPRHGGRVGKPGRPERIFHPRMDEKRSTGVAFLLVTSLWPSKEKSPARPGGVRKKTWTSLVIKRECVSSPALRAPSPEGRGEQRWIPAFAGMTASSSQTINVIAHAPTG
jgi:hypothetical protein